MLDKIKSYFNITNTDDDSVIEMLIDIETDKLSNLKISDTMLFDVVVQDFSFYKEHGGNPYTVSKNAIRDYPEWLKRELKESKSRKVILW